MRPLRKAILWDTFPELLEKRNILNYGDGRPDNRQNPDREPLKHGHD
jgi:hypothetical protein